MEFMGVAPGFEQRFLRQIFGRLAVAGEPRAQADDVAAFLH